MDAQRRRYPEQLLEKLFEIFQKNRYPSIEDKKWLCAETGLTRKQVAMWLVNHRRRAKRCEARKSGSSSRKLMKFEAEHRQQDALAWSEGLKLDPIIPTLTELSTTSDDDASSVSSHSSTNQFMVQPEALVRFDAEHHSGLNSTAMPAEYSAEYGGESDLLQLAWSNDQQVQLVDFDIEPDRCSNCVDPSLMLLFDRTFFDRGRTALGHNEY